MAPQRSRRRAVRQAAQRRSSLTFEPLEARLALAAVDSGADPNLLRTVGSDAVELLWDGRRTVAFRDSYLVEMPTSKVVSPGGYVEYVAATPRVAAGWSARGLGMGYFSIRTPGASVKDVQSWAASVGVVSIEPNQVLVKQANPAEPVLPRVVPSDRQYSQLQWGLNNSGKPVSSNNALALSPESVAAAGVGNQNDIYPRFIDSDIDATEAWYLQTGNREPIVAVFDDGIDDSHPDLGANMWTRPSSVPATWVNPITGNVEHLVGSSQIAPTYWLNPANGVSYSVVIQTPQYTMDSLERLNAVPVTGSGAASPQVLGGLTTISRTHANAVVSQYDLQTMVQINATTEDRDLASVTRDIRRVLERTAAQVPKGSSVVLLGQVRTMERAFTGLFFGLLGAIGLVYLLIVVNFQSWADPFVIVTALPAALAGIVWMLFATGTTLSVPALTGAIMCMGVATANSVLVISFARERLAETGDALRAALEAGYVRFRPVLMTALAMIIGMLPMALGMGEGGEQNAPLGRAVIGGLLFATVATLLFVPVVFMLVHRHERRNAAPTPLQGDAIAA